MKKIVEEYKLTKEEFTVVQTSFVRYINAIEQYKLYNVGFEKDPEKRIEKIISYKFDEDEIEEAFFMPLRFDEKVLIGRDSELYKRRALLKELTKKWNDLSPLEQVDIEFVQSLTQEELHYITSTRKSIDEAKAKVKQKQ